MTDHTETTDEGAGGSDPSKPRVSRRALLYLALALVATAVTFSWTRLRPIFSKQGVELEPAEAVASGPLAGLRLGVRYGSLKFERPVFVTEAPDETGYLYVLEQAGRIHRFKKAETGIDRTEVVLDLRAKVSRSGNEEGLLGLAFHPEFARNRTFYIYYSAEQRGPRSVVARFKLRDDGTADPESEQVVLEVGQPYRNHNGGCIAFGPDQKLYIGLGDGGWAGDPKDHGLNKGTLLGAILRIDVDRTEGDLAYAIPPDNPFVKEAGARGEVWAYGLRNPWRFSFDRETGDLWAGDVGQNAWEEVHVIHKGGNHGWRAYEGFAVYNKADLDRAPDPIEPLAAYGRGEGKSITGGYVYRGSRFPALQGRYLYADFASGAVWALTRDPEAPGDREHARHPTAKGVRVTKLVAGGPPIASFGEDRDGEVYACSFDGRIYGFERGPPPAKRAGFPDRLSQTGWFASLQPVTPARRAIPYEVNLPQWLDGAVASRFLLLPQDGRVGFRARDPWLLPQGAILVQTIRLEGRPIETRALRRDDDGFSLATYAWNEAGREARRVVDGSDAQVAVHDRSTGRTVRRPWRYQSEAECRACHARPAGVTLGLRTAQLNHRTQIATWIGERRFRPDQQPPAGDLARFPQPDGPEALETRTRAWLDVSCSHCHRPGSTGNAAIDLRLSTPLAKTGLLGHAVNHPLGLGQDARLVQPGDPERSVVYLRVARGDPQRAMPPAGATLPDPRGLELLRAWITSLKGK